MNGIGRVLTFGVIFVFVCRLSQDGGILKPDDARTFCFVHVFSTKFAIMETVIHVSLGTFWVLAL